jgi:thiol-disulfide isomerase/thioredoxin
LPIKLEMSKIVARSIRNAEYQRLRDGDLAILFFREACPYCKDFKPTWNRVARKLNEGRRREYYSRSNSQESPRHGEGQHDRNNDDERRRGYQDERDNRGGGGGENEHTAPRLEVVKLDVTKFPAVKNYIQFPTVPCIAMYKQGQHVVFLTTQDRSLPNILGIVENYYNRSTLPPSTDYVVGTEDGRWPIAMEQGQPTLGQHVPTLGQQHATTSGLAPPISTNPTSALAPTTTNMAALATFGSLATSAPAPSMNTVGGVMTGANVLLKEENEFALGNLPGSLASGLGPVGLGGDEENKNMKKQFNQEIKKRQALLTEVDQKINLQKQALQKSLEQAEKSLQNVKGQLQSAQQKLQQTQEELTRKQEELEIILQKRKQIEEQEALKNQESAARFIAFLRKGHYAPL